MREAVILVLGLVVIFGCVALMVVPDAVADTTRDILGALGFVAQALAWATGLAALIVLGYAVLLGIERLKITRARRHQVQHDADVKLITVGAGEVAIAHHRQTGIFQNLTMTTMQAYPVGYNEGPDVGRQIWREWNLMNMPRQVTGAQAKMIEAAREPVDLLSYMMEVQRGLLIGPSGAGKTTFLKLFLQAKAHDSHVLILDPHAGPDSWPVGEVVGRGSDHEAINKALLGIKAEMIRRYREIGQGRASESGHPKLVIAIDELMAIIDDAPDAKDVLRRLITQARKANIELYCGTHSDRVDALGLAGRGDLREGLVIVYFNLDQVTGRRWATIKKAGSREEIPAVLPAVSSGGTWSVDKPVARGDGDGQFYLPEPDLDEWESQVLELHARGLPVSRIAEEVFGSKGGHQNEAVKEILRKHGAVV